LRIDAEREKMFPPLTIAQMDLVMDICRSGHDADVVIEKFNFTITRSDLRTLKPSIWLNDMVLTLHIPCLYARLLIVTA
jgi:Ulp1 family protease